MRLKEKFGGFGEVGDVYIPRQFTELRDYAFVRYIDKRSAEDATHAPNGAEFAGLEIRVQESSRETQCTHCIF
jgi:RNA recognition motif-containing protein